MCGFAGELAANRAADFDAVEAMAQTMGARGPDGAGRWSMDGVALGHRRLKIIDLSSAGDQPMTDPKLGLTIAFNGCIYNHRELRRELEADGYRFFSASDTEVILKAYARWEMRAIRPTSRRRPGRGEAPPAEVAGLSLTAVDMAASLPDSLPGTYPPTQVNAA